MMVGPIDDDDINRRLCERPGRSQSPEARADDNDTGTNPLAEGAAAAAGRGAEVT
jgi:hypothetical protein